MARLRFGRPISLRWNGLLLEGPANTVFEIPDEYYDEFDEDIGTVEPTLEWLDADEGETIRDRLDALEAGGGAELSSDAALALGTASAGVGTEASRDDHVHPTTGLALSAHNHDGTYSSTSHDHSGTYEPVNTAILKSIVDAKGDIIVATAADTVSRLAVGGTNDYVLTVDSSTSTGLAWKAQTGGGGGGASLSNDAALALGTASSGTGSEASRDDHVHPTTGLSLSGHDHDAAYAPIGDANRADIVYETCKNSSGTTIAKGKVVYIDGADGTNPTIALADADTEATSSKTLGFTETSSNNGDQVNVITHGRITNIDTSGASTEGVAVWLSGTAGSYVFGSPPAEPAHAVYLGVVTKKNVSTGEIFVKVQNGYELDELHDVSAASPTAGDVIQWATDGSNYMWRKKSLADAGISASGHGHGTAATGGTYGLTTLEDSTSSTSTTTAAVPNSVKTSYDFAATKAKVSVGTATPSTPATGDIWVDTAGTATAINAVPLAALNATGAMIYGGGVGTAATLAIGTADQQLVVSGGVPAWATSPDIAKSTLTTTGDIIYASGSATPARLGVGTAGQVLGIAAGVPAWTTPSSGGGMTIIGTATPSAATTISFTSIPNTYKHLMLIWTGVFQSVTGEQFFVRLNNDNAGVYDYNGITATGSTVSDGTNADATGFGQLSGSTTAPIALTASSASDLTKTSNGVMMIYRYTDTGDRHVQWSQTSFRTAATSGYIWNNMRGVYSPTAGSAIDRIDFIRSATQTVTGTIYLYGVS